jgi:hypothetical protein
MAIVAYAIVYINTKTTTATIEDPTTTLTTMTASTIDTLAATVEKMWLKGMSLIFCTVSLILFCFKIVPNIEYDA